MIPEPPLDHAPVVVGVDGSRAAINAVRWAAAEALARDVRLRLVHAVATPTPDDEVLERATIAATAGRGPIAVEAVSTVGPPEVVLVRESSDASMICVGSRPFTGDDAPSIGPTARALAEGARCPVAVIRTRRDGSPQTAGVIAVVLSDDEDTDATVHLAMHEGRLRHATVRQIDRRTDSWVRRYPDVPVELVASGTGRQYVRNDFSHNGIGLAVVGRRDADELAEVGKNNSHPIVGYPDCSLLLVRA